MIQRCITVCYGVLTVFICHLSRVFARAIVTFVSGRGDIINPGGRGGHNMGSKHIVFFEQSFCHELHKRGAGSPVEMVKTGLG